MSAPIHSARIANRNGKPAYLDAPPRLRQSDVKRPLQPLEQPRKGWLARLWGRGA